MLLNICTQCHDLGRVRRTRLGAEGWAETLQTMLNEGAPLTDKDFETVLRYLARNFKPERYYRSAPVLFSSRCSADLQVRPSGSPEGLHYFARGVGRTWNFTTFGRVPLPPSWCHGVYIE